MSPQLFELVLLSLLCTVPVLSLDQSDHGLKYRMDERILLHDVFESGVGKGPKDKIDS